MGNTAGAGGRLDHSTSPVGSEGRDGDGLHPGGTARADAELRPTEEQSHVFKTDIFNRGGCKHVLSLDYGHKQLFTFFEKLFLFTLTNTHKHQYRADGELLYQSSSQGFREDSNYFSILEFLVYVSSSVSMNLPARVLLKAGSRGIWSSSTKQGEFQAPETLSLH